MNSSGAEPEMTREELMSVLFAEMVIQQSNLAMVFLGLTPNPETGKPVRDLETARLFIDQLEMLEAKTKGNLTKEESDLLKQSLHQLRMAFVQVSGQPQPAATPASEPPAAESATSRPKAETPPEPEDRKKFTKKY